MHRDTHTLECPHTLEASSCTRGFHTNTGASPFNRSIHTYTKTSSHTLDAPPCTRGVYTYSEMPPHAMRCRHVLQASTNTPWRPHLLEADTYTKTNSTYNEAPH